VVGGWWRRTLAHPPILGRGCAAAAGIGVAMSNAVPAVQAAASVVVGSNDQDGVAEALERYVL